MKPWKQVMVNKVSADSVMKSVGQKIALLPVTGSKSTDNSGSV